MTSCEHHQKLLRMLYPPSTLGNVSVDKAIFEGSALNLRESTVTYTNVSINERIDQFCSFNAHFQLLFGRMKRRFEKCLYLHCQYMEIYHRLNKISTCRARTFRHYMISHLAVLIQTLMQVLFLLNGLIVRSEDAAETPANHIDPYLFMAFCNANVNTDENTTIQSSLTSVSGIKRLQAGLLEDMNPHDSRQCAVKQFDEKLASCRENLLNWHVDSLDMIEMFQSVVDTRICVGYIRDAADKSGYSLHFVPHRIKGQNLSISPQTIGSLVDLDYELINYNIENTLIAESIDCSVGSEVLADQDYQNVVSELLTAKQMVYQQNEKSLRLTVHLKETERILEKIRIAESTGIYVDEKHLFWW